MEKITASFENLFSQATATSHTYFREAIKNIDSEFGAGYASKNPNLVGALVIASAIDMGSSILAKTIPDMLEYGADSLSSSLDRVAAELE